MTIVANLCVFSIVQMDSHLHSPMYFFLRCLSMLDICYSSVTLPAMLHNAIMDNRRISFNGCLLQLFFFVCFGGTEFLLLAVMAYDRYVAICDPLHYTTKMNDNVCSYLVAGCCINGLLNSTFHTLMTYKLNFCGSRPISHYFCDVLPLLRAACSDVHHSQVLLHLVTLFIGIIPFIIVMNSYIHVISTIMKIPSTSGRQKVFSTCSSHLIIVIVFYLTGMFNYNGPYTKDSFVIVRVSSLLYGAVPSLLNPVVYCLRNHDVRRAMKNVLTKGFIIKR
ncbi:olfactory receptor 1F1-like [Gastrophryne carolinensis]